MCVTTKEPLDKNVVKLASVFARYVYNSRSNETIKEQDELVKCTNQLTRRGSAKTFIGTSYPIILLARDSYVRYKRTKTVRKSIFSLRLWRPRRQRLHAPRVLRRVPRRVPWLRERSVSQQQDSCTVSLHHRRAPGRPGHHRDVVRELHIDCVKTRLSAGLPVCRRRSAHTG